MLAWWVVCINEVAIYLKLILVTGNRPLLLFISILIISYYLIIHIGITFWIIAQKRIEGKYN